jgi:hypothetical protein
LKGDKYQDQLAQSIALVKLRAIEINEEAKICHESRARKMDEDMASGFGNIKSLIHEVLAEVTAERYHRLLLAHPDIDRHTRQPYQKS